MKKNFHLPAISRSMAFLLLVLFAGTMSMPLAAKENCNTACNDYVKCTAEIHQRQPTAKERKTLLGGCMVNCKSKKYGHEILQCHAKATKSDNLCKVYTNCVISKLQK